MAIPNHFIFTITTGRTGTKYLTQLIKYYYPTSTSLHELTSPTNIGFTNPDLSHLIQFNHHGNCPHVKKFWRQKLKHILSLDTPLYAESSHQLAKSGLIENLNLFPKNSRLIIFHLTREPIALATSLLNIGAFVYQVGNWYYFLDPDYSRNLLPHFFFIGKLGSVFGLILWYIYEMNARAELYSHVLKAQKHIVFRSIDLSQLTNLNTTDKLFKDLNPKLFNPTNKPPPKTNSSRFHHQIPPEILNKINLYIPEFDFLSQTTLAKLKSSSNPLT